MILTFDLETLPTNDPAIIEELAKGIKPPATHKKQETIDAWMIENKESALKELVAKTSFDGALGRIACIAWSIDDEPVFVSGAEYTELEAIKVFYDFINMECHDVTFCGHNLAGFDLPFLKHRSIIHGIKPPKSLLQAMNAKPWDSCIADTMLMWSSDSQKRASMDKLCKALGIQGKEGFDGSQVAETWPVDPQKVIEYCKDDVRRTRAIYKRINFI
jgi:predicted PolB exonuclease-like 3'-5' exonuclease